MNLELVEKIANAVLYEGYMLYPYRASTIKNQQRFNWGALAPESYSAATKNTEVFQMQTECLASGDEDSTINIKIRFLHLLRREIGAIENSLDKLPPDFSDFRLVQSLEIGDRTFHSWQEASEREIDFPSFNLGKDETRELSFSFPAERKLEPLRGSENKIIGVIVRTQQSIEGVIEVQSTKYEVQSLKSVFKLTVRIKNLTPFENAENKTREDALWHSTIATHTILTVQNGEFISLLEPPDELKELAESCENIKTYPVLAGDEPEKDCILSSPIILYDYPQIAQESTGDLFDGGEIDEILTLRIMTLTDEEKREMRDLDDHTRKILERTEMMPEEQLLKMHGALKSLGKAVKGNE